MLLKDCMIESVQKSKGKRSGTLPRSPERFPSLIHQSDYRTSSTFRNTCQRILARGHPSTVSGLRCRNKMAAGNSGMLLARKEALNRLETALKDFPPLLERSFITCENGDRVSDRKMSEFRVMQWNVLADGTV